MADSKSILDGVEITYNPQHLSLQPTTLKRKEIVGNCPQCGAPVYGDKAVLEGQPASVTYSCHCFRRLGQWEQKEAPQQ